MAVGRQNRPFKYGAKDRREFIVQDSEVSLRAQNDASGNPIYIGRAKVGTPTSVTKWQIQFLTWDGNNSVTSLTWPQNENGNASSEYEFEWDERTNYTYS
jgi:hypothetical protein